MSRPALTLGIALACLSAAAQAQDQPPVYVTPVGGATALPPGSNSGTVTVSPPTPGQSSSPATVYAVGGGPVTVMPPAPGGTATDPGGPQLPGSAPPPSPPHRYRLIASSFFVDHQTVDDMLERDGRGDEIFVRADWFDYRDRGRLSAHAVVKSAVFGERGQFRAGSARPGFNSADDQPGGLITNDSYSPGGDNFADTPSRQQGNLPMVLWEGTLRPGDEVMVVPSIWEWDSEEKSRAEVDWDHWLGEQARRLQLGAPRAPGAPAWPQYIDGAIVSDDVLGPLDVYDIGNRPIGAMVWEHRRGPGMRAHAIVLTYDGAFRAADRAMMFGARITNEDGTVTSAEYPGPVGGFSMSFADPPQLQGVYTLFLRLVRLN